MFFRICFWFCGMILLTPTMEKMIFLSSVVAIVCYLLFVVLWCHFHSDVVSIPSIDSSMLSGRLQKKS